MSTDKEGYEIPAEPDPVLDDVVVEALVAAGFDVLSFSMDGKSVTLFDGTHYLDITISEYTEDKQAGEDA